MITVLIPTYNRKNRLARTLDSLEQQSNNDFNIIISDNASDWVWLVSDDDIIESDAIQKIHDAILKYSDCAWMNFEIYQNDEHESEREIIGLKDYVEYLFECRSRYHYLTTADLIFMSDKVFYLAIIKDYISLAVEFAYSYIPHVFLLLKSLEENKKSCYTSSKNCWLRCSISVRAKIQC